MTIIPLPSSVFDRLVELRAAKDTGAQAYREAVYSANEDDGFTPNATSPSQGLPGATWHEVAPRFDSRLTF